MSACLVVKGFNYYLLFSSTKKAIMEAINKALKDKKQIGFDVTDPMRSFAGYTVYRLHLKV